MIKILQLSDCLLSYHRPEIFEETTEQGTNANCNIIRYQDFDSNLNWLLYEHIKSILSVVSERNLIITQYLFYKCCESKASPSFDIKALSLF